MGRSLASLPAASTIERYDLSAHNPFDAAGFRYLVRREGECVWHAETAADAGGPAPVRTEAEVRYAVGSGSNGRAYLIDRDGYLFASPITWYPRKQIWDLSPGYEKGNPRFGRPVTPDCLFCHANYADHVAGTVNRYRAPIFHGEAIGCERCHGPGELHVRRREANEPVDGLDNTIVNPARLEPALREAVCQQCHLQGQQRILRRGRSTFDFRPGLPLHLFVTELVKPPKYQGTKFVGSVEQMVASRCYQKSAGPNRLTCTSCHDPHELPAAERKVEYYRQRCMECHKDHGCTLPLPDRLATQKDDSCVACHMQPTGSNIIHTTIADHRILRRPEAAPTPPADDWPATADMPLVHFHRHLLDGPDPEVDRALGLALVQLAESQPAGVARLLAQRALPALDEALGRDDADGDAWHAKGAALMRLNELDAAAAAYERALRAEPDRETTLYYAADLYLLLGRTDAALAAAQRAVRVNPWRWEYYKVLAQAAGSRGAWPEALAACEKALSLNAADPAARWLKVVCHFRMGNRAEAEREFDTLMALKPPGADRFREMFAQESRRAGGGRPTGR
ncbi:MAG: tetratricopeptide repeat protein [Gemmataceae bacterium]